MKFLLAIFAYIAISLILGWGILQAVHGKPAILIVAFVAYALAFAKLGCLPGKSH